MSVQASKSSLHVSEDDARREPTMPTQSAAGYEKCNVQLSRWWFASEVCPLLAGTLGPLATGFGACSLTTGWIYISVRHQDEIHVRVLGNPVCAQFHRLIALNAISVGSGLISNATIFLFIWSRLSFVIYATGLLIQSSILISLLIATRSSTPSPKISGNYHFAQAYYYAIISAALSFTTLICVASNGLGLINKYYSKQQKVGSTQANLFRQSIALTVYLLIGAAIYARAENWPFLDALFWADFTLLTIGLGGDFTPKTALGRGLLLPYAIGGIALVALLVISVRRLLMRGRSRLTDHLAEKSREYIEKRLLAKDEASTSMGDENTFNLVRRIALDAERRCSLVAFALSVIATLALLLVGAAILKIAETGQLWTYGVSVYFAYVSLLTIGYGDYIPESESSKPFFVVWSLLSVPVLTIFINNSVDTVYGSIRGFLLFFIRLVCNRRRHMMTVLPSLESAQVAQDPVPHNGGNQKAGPINAESSSGRTAERIPELIFPETGEPSRQRRRTPCRTSQAQLRLHCYLLAKGLGVIINDIKSEPGKKYSYEEWAYYISLMGHTMSHQHFDEEVQQNGGLKSKCKHAAGSSFAPCPLHSINWASRGTPILFQNEAEWISSRLSTQLAGLLHGLVSHDTNEHRKV
ncbi:hypothetical protein K469DRAFT_750461 [Zopfia rhizophila CBS 207.26]|uniref:Potassium channel domain-containing protein n=1 Tax=Zopfia rhizophila CBS 207.26 TaxID=1314779 RepID=A0A6A6E472_9PEZI|nr:hypothetical protein K469DRAFT_750461 [Zopfia rhizophila CBS 207.26]